MAHLAVAARVENLEEPLLAAFGRDEALGAVRLAEEPPTHEFRHVIGLERREDCVSATDRGGERLVVRLVREQRHRGQRGVQDDGSSGRATGRA